MTAFNRTTEIEPAYADLNRTNEIAPASQLTLTEPSEPAHEPSRPTAETYGVFSDAFDYFNQRLFAGKLPPCLCTFQRKANSRGYFAPARFIGRDDAPGQTIDEIALNPKYVHEYTPREVLSVLVHEMVHMAQAHFGQPSTGGYHNREWAEWMKQVGLYPSDTAAPGGKETGPHMSHYVVAGGLFDSVCSEFLERNPGFRYGDKPAHEPRESVDPTPGRTGKSKAESKTKFTCTACGFNVWCRRTGQPWCGACGGTPMECAS
jgi:SprT-like family protein